MQRKTSGEQYVLEIMRGSRKGVAAGMLRAAMAVAEPAYAGVMTVRNHLYDVGVMRSVRLPRPVISVGNITTGGTGKTPMVRWLAERLRDAGRHVAILSRGYKSAPGTLGDEQRMLAAALEAPGRLPVRLECDPKRTRGADRALREHREIDVFILDDGFQHRAVMRDVDLVLVNAEEPFGFGHVLPRGLLREPLRGLRRANAVVLTHADRVSEEQRRAIEDRIRILHPGIPIYQAFHASVGLRSAGPSAAMPPDRTVESLRGVRVYAFCGIAKPDSFQTQLEQCGVVIVGHRWFGDHHAYTPEELSDLRREASGFGAEMMVTTEKDWAKVGEVPGAADLVPPIWRLEVAIRFMGDDEERLMQQVVEPIGSIAPAESERATAGKPAR